MSRVRGLVERASSAASDAAADLGRLRRELPVSFVVWTVLIGSLAVTPVVVGYRVWVSEAVTAWGVDFKAYYLAGLRARHGVGLYDPGWFVDAVPSPAARRFLYPPAVVLALVPLTVLPPDVARVLWVVVQALALAAGVVWLLRAWGVDLRGWRAVVAGWCVLGFYPVTHLARVGNVVGFQVAALCVAAGALSPGLRWRCDGWSRAVAVTVPTVVAATPKPFVGLAAGPLLRRRRLLVAATTTVGVLAAGVVAFGVDAHVAYVASVADDGLATTNPGAVGVHYEPFRALDAAAVGAHLAVLVVAVGTVLALRIGVTDDGRHRRGLPAVSRDATALAVGTVAVPLVVPSTNTLELCFAVPGVALAYVGERRAGSDRVATAVVAALAVVHFSQWGARVLVFVGPALAPAMPWRSLGDVLYAIRPATVGLLVVLGVLVGRTFQRAADHGNEKDDVVAESTAVDGDRTV